ncbi:hypothetical protein DFH08DRAFT_775109 [Mycena albidolilacea]|uniref:Uncharacterized protein n=1 Tax=Mycena albidolilacea TaxID=1033008 RepID=A0AAD7A8R2_9AGAR|nr:hypothetical protein DFH08DRAFT_775109 [Mycena albidolilacea]
MEPEFSLPLYSPSHPSPCYSEDPACDETRLDLSPRNGTRPLPTGIFTQACGSITVVLYDQEPTTHIPSYRQQGSVRGSLIIEQDLCQISEVAAKLEGRLEIITTDSGALTIKVFKNTYCLWASSSSSSTFPGAVDITCNFPAAFQHQNREYPLPPSYGAKFPGFPPLFFKCTYSLTISITKDRRLGFLIDIPIEYKPEGPPAHGIPSIPSFLSSLKAVPEEWHQTSFVMKARSSSTLSPIQCQAFIPSARVFGLSDTIPLHLQISGCLSSLRELIPPPSSRSNDEHSPIRVYLTRMVTFEYRGKSTWRIHRIGEGYFSPLPPTVNFDCHCRNPSESCASCVETLDWNGNIKCDSSIAVGGFQAAGIIVKDFISLEIVPQKAVLSPLLTVQHAIPIRFVTQTFVAPT